MCGKTHLRVPAAAAMAEDGKAGTFVLCAGACLMRQRQLSFRQASSGLARAGQLRPGQGTTWCSFA